MKRTLDLRGEVCPYTFVRAKLVLEEDELLNGDELDIVLDHRPAFFSLPRAMREEGHEVLPLPSQAPDHLPFTITVRKRAKAGLPESV